MGRLTMIHFVSSLRIEGQAKMGTVLALNNVHIDRMITTGISHQTTPLGRYSVHYIQVRWIKLCRQCAATVPALYPCPDSLFPLSG